MRSDDSDSTQVLFRYPSSWLIAATLALLIGQAIAASPLIFPPVYLSLLLIPLPFIFWRVGFGWAVLCLLSAVALSAGYWRHLQLLEPKFPPDHLRSVIQEDSRLYLEGVLHQEPEKLPQRSRWLVRVLRVWHPTGSQEISGDILLTVRTGSRDWHYGDRIRFWVEPRIPRDNGNPGGFDYAAFLARRGIYATGFLVSDRSVELLSRAPPGAWSALESLRREIRRFIDQSFPSPDDAALMKALVVGDMGGISRETRADFTVAGVNHVLSISGLHVGMLGVVVFLLVRFLGSFSAILLLRFNLLKLATFCSFLAVLFYTALAGAAVPTVRSAIMIGVYELAVLLDREEEVFASLALAALLIALVWPGVVMDISFQLSFLAVLFIVWGSRKMLEWWPAERRRDELPQERSRWRPLMRRAVLYLAVPLLATVGTGPMIAHHFGHLSWAGFISNPLVVPLVGFVIVPLGLVIGFFAVTAPALAAPFVSAAAPLSALLHQTVHYLARLPMANLAVPLPNYWEVALLYAAILSVLLFRRPAQLAIALGFGSLLILGDGYYWWQERWHRKELRVTHLSVGHGDAAVVEFPGSRVLLIDAGGSAGGEFDIGGAIVAPFLRSRKILKVDYLLVSHPRVDHYGGMRTVVEEFAPVEFWSGPGKGRTARYEDLEGAVERSGVKRIYLGSREPCREVEGVKLCVVYPPDDDNDEGSVVLRLSFDRVRFLFGSDIDGRDEKLLLADGANISSAVVKAPRHGSVSSSTDAFVAAVKPRLAIFSVGSRNGLPHENVLGRYAAAGAKILRTDQDGAITIETDGRRIRYRTYRSGKRGELGY
ncbi:MAG TPA: DNA internalization-related competence protein ComEC/Rec2 [Candidatus Binatia bacterium]|jgi:competence protein ComEC